VAAARALESGAPGAMYNVGRGEGGSVLDLLRIIGEVTGPDTTPDVVERRPGVPARCVASVRRIHDDLGFVARRELHDMIASGCAAWRFQHPDVAA
jgi:UDP-glucose 4-epimerase